MTIKNRTIQKQQNEVDMTPMLDIVFILLIFFIVTTSFIREEGLVISRPKANISQPNNNPVIMVQISPTGLLNFNGKPVDIERLSARIESFIAKSPTLNAVVIPSYETSHQNVVKVIDQIKKFRDIEVAIGR